MKNEAWFICSMADSGVLSDVWGSGITLHTLMTCMPMFVAPLQFLPLETDAWNFPAHCLTAEER